MPRIYSQENASGSWTARPALKFWNWSDALNITPYPPLNARQPETVLLDLLAANRAYRERAVRKAAKEAIIAKAGT